MVQEPQNQYDRFVILSVLHASFFTDSWRESAREKIKLIILTAPSAASYLSRPKLLTRQLCRLFMGDGDRIRKVHTANII